VAKHVAKLAGGAEDVSMTKIIIAVVTLIATAILVTYISHAAKKALDATQKC
jgi:small-conductance mechanosensitive channel